MNFRLPNSKKTFQNQKGFTLIELLVVVSVIAVLSGLVLSVVNTAGIRARARDSQRAADLKKIQVALELYFSDYRNYPSSSNWTKINGATDALSQALNPSSEGVVYMNAIPTDPNESTGTSPCAEGNFGYYYKTSTNNLVYVLATVMEVEASAETGVCSELNNFGVFGSGDCQTAFCYGVENP